MGKEQNEQRRSKAVLFTKVLPMHAKFKKLMSKEV